MLSQTDLVWHVTAGIISWSDTTDSCSNKSPQQRRLRASFASGLTSAMEDQQYIMSGETRVYRAIALGCAIFTSIDRTQLFFFKKGKIKNKQIIRKGPLRQELQTR